MGRRREILSNCECFLEAFDRACIIGRGHLRGAKTVVTPAHFATGATVIRIGRCQRLKDGDSFSVGSDGLRLVWIEAPPISSD